MEGKSHVDVQKINRMPQGQSFEYKDVVREDLPISQHSADGALFNREVENKVYDKVIVSDPDATHVVYKKIEQ